MDLKNPRNANVNGNSDENEYQNFLEQLGKILQLAGRNHGALVLQKQELTQTRFNNTKVTQVTKCANQV